VTSSSTTGTFGRHHDGRSPAAALLLLVVLGIAAFGLAAVPAEAAPRIVIRTPRASQVVQRDAAGTGVIVVRGVGLGFGGRVQVRWGQRRWRVVSRARNGSFTCRLGPYPPGQATLEVRSVRRRRVTASRAAVGIGDVYVIAGQSNASGRGTSLFACEDPAYTAMLFGNDDRWRPLADPTDTAEGQIDRVSADVGAGGSVWPLVARRLMAEERTPVAFIPCARVGTPLRRWQRPARGILDGSTLYGSMVRRVAAAGGRVRAVLFWQGEADAKRQTPGDVYEGLLVQFARDVRRDCRAPLVVAQIGDYGPAFTDAGVDAVRLAQARVWGRDGVVAGPVLYDIDLEGVVHFSAVDDVTLAADRWSAAVLGGVLGADVPRAPQLGAVTWDGDREIAIAVAAGASPLTPGTTGGFTVSAGDVSVPVESATVEADGTVRLVLTERPASAPAVALGSGRTGAGAPVPVEGSAWRLPMAPFVTGPVLPPGA
jgi:hypothetical protein